MLATCASIFAYEAQLISHSIPNIEQLHARFLLPLLSVSIGGALQLAPMYIFLS